MVSRLLMAGLENCLERLLCTSAAIAAVCSSVRSVSIDCDDASRAWHLELEVCVVRHRIELGKCGSREQCVLATAERDYVED